MLHECSSVCELHPAKAIAGSFTVLKKNHAAIATSILRYRFAVNTLHYSFLAGDSIVIPLKKMLILPINYT